MNSEIERLISEFRRRMVEIEESIEAAKAAVAGPPNLFNLGKRKYSIGDNDTGLGNGGHRASTPLAKLGCRPCAKQDVAVSVNDDSRGI